MTSPKRSATSVVIALPHNVDADVVRIYRAPGTDTTALHQLCSEIEKFAAEIAAEHGDKAEIVAQAKFELLEDLAHQFWGPSPELISKLAMVGATASTNGKPRLGISGAEEICELIGDILEQTADQPLVSRPPTPITGEQA